MFACTCRNPFQRSVQPFAKCINTSRRCIQIAPVPACFLTRDSLVHFTRFYPSSSMTPGRAALEMGEGTLRQTKKTARSGAPRSVLGQSQKVMISVSPREKPRFDASRHSLCQPLRAPGESRVPGALKAACSRVTPRTLVPNTVWIRYGGTLVATRWEIVPGNHSAPSSRVSMNSKLEVIEFASGIQTFSAALKRGPGELLHMPGSISVVGLSSRCDAHLSRGRGEERRIRNVRWIITR